MRNKFLSRVFQAALICSLTTVFTGCDDILSAMDNPIQTALSMSTRDVELAIGEQYQCEVITASPAPVIYTSSDPAVAAVSANGTVTAVGKGTATITASVDAVDYWLATSKSFKVTVVPEGAATVTTAPEAPTDDIMVGSETVLVTAGEADGGEMMYLLTSEKNKPTTTDDFTTTVPTSKDLEPGSYYVWYYAKGDATHNDSEIADPVKVTVFFNVDLSGLTDHYEAKDGAILTGSAAYIIEIEAGATVKLSNATVSRWVRCLGDATIILAEGTENIIYGYNTTALLVGPEGTTLIIKGKGKLEAHGNYWGNNYVAAGIGARSAATAGNIVIEDGIINAYGYYGASIGSNCFGSSIGDITIKGGTVTAVQQAEAGAGIGSGLAYSGESRCGNITITGGTVVAYGGETGAGIGAGGLYWGYNDYESSCGNITITGGNVTAYGGKYAAAIGSGVKYYSSYTNTSVCGDITISDGTVVAMRGSYSLYDIGPGEYSSNPGVFTGKVGTISVSVEVKDSWGNDAIIYAP